MKIAKPQIIKIKEHLGSINLVKAIASPEIENKTLERCTIRFQNDLLKIADDNNIIRWYQFWKYKPIIKAVCKFQRELYKTYFNE